MPAWYHSHTHASDFEAVIVSMNKDGLLDLAQSMTDTNSIVKRRADPVNVKERYVPGWFVPDRHTYVAPANPVHVTNPAVRLAAAVPPPSQPAPPPAPPPTVWQVLYAFNGPDYGPDYLVLSVGDTLD